MLMLVRCVLAFSALAIIWIDPSEPTRLVEVTYASLGAYCLYSRPSVKNCTVDANLSILRHPY